MEQIADDFLIALPKTELHLHIEGSFEPELMFEIARRNHISIPYDSIDDLRAAYNFNELQDFLDIYYQGMSVLLTEQDFYDLTWAYLQRAHADGVIHTEIFFDPQGHTERGVPFETVISGISCALKDAQDQFAMTSCLIMCFLRHLSEEDAIATWQHAQPFLHMIDGVGLDSSEVGHPPSKFAHVFKMAAQAGLKRVAHAGEEGPPSYVKEALDILGVDRLDHGNRAMEDPALVDRLVQEGMALTVCPLSNTRLCVVDRMENHPLKDMLDQGLKVTVNSDDPAYFGGYVGQNYMALRDALPFTQADFVTLALNSITASFAPEARKNDMLNQLQNFVNTAD